MTLSVPHKGVFNLGDTVSITTDQGTFEAEVANSGSGSAPDCPDFALIAPFKGVPLEELETSDAEIAGGFLHVKAPDSAQSLFGVPAVVTVTVVKEGRRIFDRDRTGDSCEMTITAIAAGPPASGWCALYLDCEGGG